MQSMTLTITWVIMQKRRERRARKESDDRDLGRGGLAGMLRPRAAKKIWIPESAAVKRNMNLLSIHKRTAFQQLTQI